MIACDKGRPPRGSRSFAGHYTSGHGRGSTGEQVLPVKLQIPVVRLGVEVIDKTQVANRAKLEIPVYFSVVGGDDFTILVEFHPGAKEKTDVVAVWGGAWVSVS